jgi:hypothetical protein
VILETDIWRPAFGGCDIVKVGEWRPAQPDKLIRFQRQRSATTISSYERREHKRAAGRILGPNTFLELPEPEAAIFAPGLIKTGGEP